MKVYLGLCVAALFLQGSVPSLLSADLDTSVEVDVGTSDDYDDDSYQVWAGPGWYYGNWYDDENAYYGWLDTGFNAVVWAGPGWYYGHWFGSENDFNGYRNNHRYYNRNELRNNQYRGNNSWHNDQRRGEWRGDNGQRGQARQGMQDNRVNRGQGGDRAGRGGGGRGGGDRGRH